jgi:hypothetical protein
MIEVSDVTAGILAGYSYKLYFRLQSWLDGEVLAEDIPAVNVVEEQDASLRVPERLTFTVPVEADGYSWVPSGWRSPLGWFGQKIFSQVGVGIGNDEIEWIDRGLFLINSVSTEGANISVECLGLLTLIDEAKLINDYQPKSLATFTTMLRALIEPALSVDVDDAPADRTLPSFTSWSDDRLDDVYTALDSWPARGRVSTSGEFEITPPLADPDISDVEFAFTEDPEIGTVINWSTSGGREGAFNAVVAQGAYPAHDPAQPEDGLPIWSTTYDTDPDSPYVFGGVFNPLFVGYGYQSPLLTTWAQVHQASLDKFAELRSRASRAVQIDAVPHPGITLDSAVSVTSERLGIDGEIGRVQSFTLPHTPEGGAMTLKVRLGGEV